MSFYLMTALMFSTTLVNMIFGPIIPWFPTESNVIDTRWCSFQFFSSINSFSFLFYYAKQCFIYGYDDLYDDDMTNSQLNYCLHFMYSRDIFNKWQAQRWWAENYDKVMELYNVQRLNRQAFPLPTPARSEDEVNSYLRLIIDIVVHKFCNWLLCITCANCLFQSIFMHKVHYYNLRLLWD
jgi:hypothetical protein